MNQTLAESGRYIAEERGYFREEGLQVESTPFDGAARMTPALASGQLDVGAGGVSASLFNAIGRGVPIKIVGPRARHERGASATAGGAAAARSARRTLLARSRVVRGYPLPE